MHFEGSYSKKAVLWKGYGRLITYSVDPKKPNDIEVIVFLWKNSYSLEVGKKAGL